MDLRVHVYYGGTDLRAGNRFACEQSDGDFFGGTFDEPKSFYLRWPKGATPTAESAHNGRR